MNKAVIDEVLAAGGQDAQAFAQRWQWWGLCLLLCLLGLVVALPALDRIPLDSHEIFVAQSVREMSARGDWLVPYFNGEPRLNKPPMNYWLTGLVAGLAGALPDVSPGHARGVSVLAGLGTLLLCLHLGAVLYGRQTALLAGLVLVSSAGYFSFTHDARPDLLYAFFTSLTYVAAVHVLRTTETSRMPLAPLLLWFGFAAATLTKGPHMPALALVGLYLHAALGTRTLRGPLRALRVWPGLVIAAVPVLAWWGWLRLQLDPAVFKHSQLAGTLLTPVWSRLGDPYYLYRPLQLLLPWLPLAGLALGAYALRDARRDTGWLWWPLLVTAVALSFGRQYRYFYLLPLIVPLTLALARPTVTLLRAALGAWPRQLLQLGLVLQALLAFACAGWVLVESGRIAWLTPPILATCGGAAAAWVTWRMLCRVAADEPGVRGYALLAATAVFIAAVWAGAGWTGVVWSKERFDAQALCEQAIDEVRAGRPLATLGISPTLYVYATNTRVPALSTGAEVGALAAAHGAIALMVHSDRLAELHPPLVATEIARVTRGRRDDVLVRVQVR